MKRFFFAFMTLFALMAFSVGSIASEGAEDNSTTTTKCSGDKTTAKCGGGKCGVGKCGGGK